VRLDHFSSLSIGESSAHQQTACAIRLRPGASAGRVERRNYRLQDIQLHASPSASAAARSLQIVWDDRRRRIDIGCVRRRTPGTSITPCVQRTDGTLGSVGHRPPAAGAFPVVIGEGPHPFPFRTRKLSPLPPMVLRGKLRGRVGHCREYFSKPLSSRQRLFFGAFRASSSSAGRSLGAAEAGVLRLPRALAAAGETLAPRQRRLSRPADAGAGLANLLESLTAPGSESCCPRVNRPAANWRGRWQLASS
jgi:hypothetical protein